MLVECVSGLFCIGFIVRNTHHHPTLKAHTDVHGARLNFIDHILGDVTSVGAVCGPVYIFITPYVATKRKREQRDAFKNPRR